MQALSMPPASKASRKPPIPPEVAIALLKALGSDDAFRQLFMSDPRMALSKVGFHLPSEAETPMCMMVDELASKEEISNAFDALYMHLTGGSSAAMFVPHFFAAGQTIKAANSVA